MNVEKGVSNYKYLSHYLEPKEAFFKTEDFDMEYNRGLQAPDDREDNEGIRSHCHPKHIIQFEECLKSSNSRSPCKRLSQQQESQLQGDLEEDLQTLKGVDIINHRLRSILYLFYTPQNLDMTHCVFTNFQMFLN